MRQHLFIAGLVMTASLFVVSTSPAFGSPRARRASAPVMTVRDFYRHHFSHEMGLTEAALKSKRRWLAPELYGLLMFERRREMPPDTAPYIDGDPFTNSQEYPNTFRVGKATQAGGTARVEVVFKWVAQGRVVEQRKAGVRLLKYRGAWRIADVVGADGASLLAGLRELKRKDGLER